MELETMLDKCEPNLTITSEEGGVREEVGLELEERISRSLSTLGRRMDAGLDAQELSEGMREAAVLGLLKCLSSESDGIVLKAAGMILDRSDGKAVGEVRVVESVGLSLGGRLIGVSDDLKLSETLRFLDQRSGGQIGKGVIELPVGDVEVQEDE